jgi:biotin carboxylase
MERGVADGSKPRTLLLYGPTSYRAPAFVAAAERLGLEVVRGLDLPNALAEEWGVEAALDFANPEATVETIAALHAADPFAAVLAVDDVATLLAARAANRLGFPANDSGAALAARDKWVMRERFAAAGVPVPAYRRFPLEAAPEEVAREVAASPGFPCVVKPLRLSGSRGVIRADVAATFAAAWSRTRRIVEAEAPPPEAAFLLVERYLPGVEVAVEGLLTGGELRTLAIFDKPDPLDGPFFERRSTSRRPVCQTRPKRPFRRGPPKPPPPSGCARVPSMPSCGSTTRGSGRSSWPGARSAASARASLSSGWARRWKP